MSKRTKILGAIILGFILILGVGDLFEGKTIEFSRDFDDVAITPNRTPEQEVLDEGAEAQESFERLATITPESFDGIVLGMYMAEVANTLSLKDLNKEVKIVDGREYDVYRVYRSEHMLYEIDISCDEEPGTCVVSHITSTSPHVQTRDGFGVGSRSGDIFGYYGVDATAWADGFLYVTTKEFADIRFGFSERDIPAEWIDEGENIGALPRDIIVESIAYGFPENSI